MSRVHEQRDSRKTDVVLRYALRESGRWNEDIEAALCNAGDEIPLVAEFYAALRNLVHDTPFADGAGDLRRPAGPRYTECWITPSGLAEIRRLDTSR
jgi:hypothetical protein